jgi:hypothetical protein
MICRGGGELDLGGPLLTDQVPLFATGITFQDT